MISRSEIIELLSSELRAMEVSLPDVLHDELSFQHDFELDSLGIAEFIARMEMVFQVEIADEEWKDLVTLGLAADYVEEHLGK